MKIRNRFVAVFVGALIVAGPVHAQIVEAELGINGLACPFCAYGLEKNLKELNGVKDWDITMDPGAATLTFAESTSAHVENFQEAVEDAGMSVRSIEILVRGTLTRENNKWVIQIDDGDHLLLVQENKKLDALMNETGLNVKQPEQDINVKVLAYGRVKEDTPPGHKGHPYGFTMKWYCLELQMIRLSVKGMKCEECPGRIEKILQKNESVHAAWASKKKKRVSALVCTENKKEEIAGDLIEALNEADFKARLEKGG